MPKDAKSDAKSKKPPVQDAPVKKASKTVRSATAKVKASPMMSSSTPLSNPADTSMFPYHLKWHEAGIEFELHSSDASFMSQQAWRVQEALVGLRQVPPKTIVPPTVRVETQAPKPTLSPILPQRVESLASSVDLDLEAFKAWVETSSKRSQAQSQQVAQVGLTSPSTRPSTIPNTIDDSLENPFEALVAQTRRAFEVAVAPVYNEPKPPSVEVSRPTEEAPEEPTRASSTPPIFSTLLKDLQKQTNPTIEQGIVHKAPLSFKVYLDTKRHQDLSEVMLLAGQYLKDYEHQSSFTLSQLKHLIEEAQAGHVNHAVLSHALSQRYVEVVPDLTGNPTRMEYRLTAVGVAYASQL